MAKLTMEHQDEILTFPVDSILELKIQEVTIETVQSQRGEDWQKARFKFKILGIQALGDGSQNLTPYESWITRDIWGSVAWRLTDSPENKLRIWAEAIFRQELGIGFELDDQMFVQRNVRGLTSQYDARAKDSNGQAFKRHQIETLLPWQDSQPAAPAAQAQPNFAPPQQQPQMAGAQQGGWAQPQNLQNQGQDPWAAPGVPPAANDPWAPLPAGDEPPF